jgi:hypothetical protein
MAPFTSFLEIFCKKAGNVNERFRVFQFLFFVLREIYRNPKGLAQWPSDIPDLHKSVGLNITEFKLFCCCFCWLPFCCKRPSTWWRRYSYWRCYWWSPEARVPESRVSESRVSESRVPESQVPKSRVPAVADVSGFASVPDVAKIPVFVNILSVPGVITVPGVPAFYAITGVAGDCVFLLLFIGISHIGRGTPKAGLNLLDIGFAQNYRSLSLISAKVLTLFFATRSTMMIAPGPLPMRLETTGCPHGASGQISLRMQNGSGVLR